MWPAGFVNVVRVTMPNKQSVQIAIRNDMTVRDVMVNSCEVGAQYWMQVFNLRFPQLACLVPTMSCISIKTQSLHVQCRTVVAAFVTGVSSQAPPPI